MIWLLVILVIWDLISSGLVYFLVKALQESEKEAQKLYWENKDYQLKNSLLKQKIQELANERKNN